MSGPSGDFDRWFNEGNRLSGAGKWADAVASYRKAVAANPRHEWALNNLGFCLHQAGEHEDAVCCLRKTLAVNPDNPMAHANLVAALEAGRRTTEAIPHRRQLCLLRPDVADHPFNLANALLGSGRVDEAIVYYRRALAILPDYSAAVCNYLLALNYSERWSPEAVAAEHVRLASRWAVKPRTPDRFAQDRDPDRPLRIGYLSADYAQHPVGKLMIPLLAAHGRSVVTYAYSDRGDEDAWTKRVREVSGVFRPVGAMSDADLGKQILADRIDVLVDLTGQTGGRPRTGLLAAGAAPIQASFLGYPNTTGCKAVDYRLTDAYSDPPGPADARYTEKLVRLERGFLCYAPPADLPPLIPPPCVQSGTVTFGSFNNPSKVSDGSMAVWARVLRAVPNSRLAVKYGGAFNAEGLRERWRDRFAVAGVEPDRLVFSPAVAGVAGHYRALGSVDIALDSFPYQGTMTTLETLSMGVPVVTLLGDTTASRASSALLMRIGLHECVTRTFDEYVAAAAALASDPARLGLMRSWLRERLFKSEVCDVPGYAAELEYVYRRMWRAWCAGAPPIS